MFVFANTPGAIFGNVPIARVRDNGHTRQSDAAGESEAAAPREQAPSDIRR